MTSDGWTDDGPTVGCLHCPRSGPVSNDTWTTVDGIETDDYFLFVVSDDRNSVVGVQKFDFKITVDRRKIWLVESAHSSEDGSDP